MSKLKLRNQIRWPQGEAGGLRPVLVLYACFISLMGFGTVYMTDVPGGPAWWTWLGGAFGVAGLAAVIREIVSPNTIAHNLLALLFLAVPTIVWLQVASGSSLGDAFPPFILWAIPAALCLWCIRLLKRDAEAQIGVLTNMPNHEDPRERPTPESEKKPGGEDRAEDDPHFNDPVRESIDSEGNPEEKRGPQDDDPPRD